MQDKILPNREVIFEFTPVGNIMKVTALDTKTLTEIAVQGPVNAGKEALQVNALKRLEYVLKKKGLV